VSPRTPTRPPNDRTMWRRVIARCHPDSGGTHELFIWTVATREAICGGELGEEIPRVEHRDKPSRRREPSTTGTERVPFDQFAEFALLTDRAVTMAKAVAEPYAYLLRQVADCYPAHEGPLRAMQTQGATYKSLAAIGHRVGMSKAERAQWYDICRAIPLSQRHAGHILSKLQRQAA
jgi:hypothetical protein